MVSYSTEPNREPNRLLPRGLVLEKSGHVYIFSYTPGSEPEVLNAMNDLAARAAEEFDEIGFDSFDARILSLQLTSEAGYFFGGSLEDLGDVGDCGDLTSLF